MAEITRKRSGELVRGVFQIMLQQVDGVPAKEVLQRLEQIVPPTDFENSTYPNHPNTRRYEKIVRFSTINAVKAGWLLKDKGTWSLTDEGKAAYEKFADPEELMDNPQSGCPFCSPAAEKIFHDGELILGIWDQFPVNEGHALYQRQLRPLH